VDELADSAHLVNDTEGLRRRLADDGYLFLRGLLPVDQVRAAGHAVLAQLRSGGWIDDRGIPSIQPRAVNSMDALPWWEPVPGDLALHPRAQMITAPPGPSALIPVHPAWQRWQPPPATVH
jgi:hypothetical protein